MRAALHSGVDFLPVYQNVMKICVSILIVDVDECKVNPCNGACINLPGSYQCICDPGYELRDGRCQGQTTQSPTVMAAI